MAYMVYKIYEIFEHLSLKEKEEVVANLQSDLEYARHAGNNSYLEDKWKEILDLIYVLSNERYIDDQEEIYEIEDIVNKLCKSNKLKKEPWDLRESIIQEILQNCYYDWYSIDDAMHDFVSALIANIDEGQRIDDWLAGGTKIELHEAAKFYKKYDKADKCYEIMEQFLEKDSKDYLELIGYYKDKDIDKAVALAEQCRKKCNDIGLTEVYVFLVKAYSERGENEKVASLIRSAKLRREVSIQPVMDALHFCSEDNCK